AQSRRAAHLETHRLDAVRESRRRRGRGMDLVLHRTPGIRDGGCRPPGVRVPRETAGLIWRTLWPRMLASLKSLLEMNMSTRNVIESYFKALEGKKGWESLLTDDVAFTSFTSPNRQITGKQAY